MQCASTLPAQIVDRVVARHHTRAGRGIAAVECFDGDANGVAHQRAQPHDVEPRRFKRLMIRGAQLPLPSFKKRQTPV